MALIRLSIVQITALQWADILAEYSLWLTQDYLTEDWRINFTHAAGIVNIWEGASFLLQVFLLFIVDARLGNFKMLVCSAVAYCVGLGLVTLGVWHTRGVCFYIGMALRAVGKSGYAVSVEPFMEEQKDNESGEPGSKARWRRRLRQLSIAAIHTMPALVALVYGHFLWGQWLLIYGIPTICHAAAIVIFLSGWCWPGYHQLPPQGSPLTTICRVFLASASKRSQPYPSKDSGFYTKNGEEGQLYSETRFLGFLKKAAIKLPGIPTEEQARHRWRLCSLAEVEEAKVAIRTLPIWMTCIPCGIVLSMGNTYFLVQAAEMGQSFLGINRIPLQVFLLILKIATLAFKKSTHKLLRRSKHYLAAPMGIGTAMMISVLCCITSAIVEHRRLDVITMENDHNESLNMFWLVFQFVLLGGLESVLKQSTAAFFLYQAPHSMRECTDHFVDSAIGVGHMWSVLSIYIVGKIRPDWFQETLDKSRLDKYYWMLAVLTSINLLVFVTLASCYSFKKPTKADHGDSSSDQAEALHIECLDFTLNLTDN